MPISRRSLFAAAVLVAAGARAADAQAGPRPASPAAAPSAAAAAGLPAVAPGDSATPAAVEALLAASDAERAYNQAIALSVAAQTRNNPALADQADLLRSFITRFASYAAIRPDIVRAYRETFTAGEVAELTQFYRSDLGRRMSAKLPLMTARTNELLSLRMQEHLPELMEMMQERMRQRPGAPPSGGL
jgi:hypothetical protein